MLLLVQDKYDLQTKHRKAQQKIFMMLFMRKAWQEVFCCVENNAKFLITAYNDALGFLMATEKGCATNDT